MNYLIVLRGYKARKMLSGISVTNAIDKKYVNNSRTWTRCQFNGKLQKGENTT
jgi:hypothetical protein